MPCRQNVYGPGALAEAGQIGNEFASVEALWSQFETVMGRENEDGVKEGSEGGNVEEQEEREGDGRK